MLTKLQQLRIDARIRINVRDAIELGEGGSGGAGCNSDAWHAAHVAAEQACRAAEAECTRLASDPATRYGAWRTESDITLMLFGYL